jgi:hypothetical protein
MKAALRNEAGVRERQIFMADIARMQGRNSFRGTHSNMFMLDGDMKMFA